MAPSYVALNRKKWTYLVVATDNSIVYGLEHHVAPFSKKNRDSLQCRYVPQHGVRTCAGQLEPNC